MRGGQAGEGADGGAFRQAPLQQFRPDPPEADDEAAELPDALGGEAHGSPLSAGCGCCSSRNRATARLAGRSFLMMRIVVEVARVTAAIRSDFAKRGPVTFGNNGIGPIPIPSRAYRKGRL